MLFNYLFTKNKEPQIISVEDGVKLEGLEIDIKYDLHNNLVVTADYNEQADPQVIATALFMLNNGQLFGTILESLLKNSDSHSKQMVLQKILSIANKLVNQTNDDSIIKPSDVFIKKHE